MELSSKSSKNSFAISTKLEAAAVVLVGFQNRRISLLYDNYNAGFTLLHYTESGDTK